MRRDALKLSGRYKAWLYGSTGGLLLTGCSWLVLHWSYASDLPAEALSVSAMKVHGALAMVFLVVFGALLPVHIRRSWRAHVNRTTGTVVIAFFVVLVITGYALYYAGSENLRATASIVHWVGGLLLPPFVIWHIWAGRRLRQRVLR